MKNLIDIPIEDILREGVYAFSGNNDGIEKYPIYDYFMQSLFLKCTGFQEQKLKSIRWEMASYDLEYREMSYLRNNVNECSNYRDKKIVFNELLNEIHKFYNTFEPKVELNIAQELYELAKDSVKTIFSNSILQNFDERTFLDYLTNNEKVSSWIPFNSLSKNKYGIYKDKDFLSDEIIKRYNLLYCHRNRCAHNLFTYKQNLPKNFFISCIDKYDNYFYFFELLIFVDKLFMKLYKKFLDSVTKNNW